HSPTQGATSPADAEAALEALLATLWQGVVKPVIEALDLQVRFHDQRVLVIDIISISLNRMIFLASGGVPLYPFLPFHFMLQGCMEPGEWEINCRIMLSPRIPHQ